MRSSLPILVILAVSMVSGCVPDAKPPLPAETQPAPTDTPLPVSTPTIPPSPDTAEGGNYTEIFLDGLGKSVDSCMPDGTRECIGVYVYDLTDSRELVSINVDVPFQFASAFKSPVLVYFLLNCRKYWEVSSPEWKSFFTQNAPDDDTGEEYLDEGYRETLAGFIANPENWGEMDTFATLHRASINGMEGPLDERYFILQQVYRMVTLSDNAAAGNVLDFVYENCPGSKPQLIDPKCGGPNAITRFNGWFNSFAGIAYEEDEPRRGLNNWSVIVTSEEGEQNTETRMATYGISDRCTTQRSLPACSGGIATVNVWTVRDLFQFYNALFHEKDEAVRKTAFEILKVDHPGASRGFMKNMARKMGVDAISKNGYFGSILADAGIIQSGDHFYIVITLSSEAGNSMLALYGQYDSKGYPVGSKTGLLEKLLEGTLTNP